ncbi:hypothetical protein RZS08_46515, partial [Arthrospira platensis SPKY1]|nr:hypothetical protein [Arthrospira platensis SPKY1]
GQPEWDAFYLQTRLQPARWLRLNFEQKVLTESLRAENFRVRASIVSARTWQVDLFADYLDGVIEQYAAQGFYQFHPRWAVTAAARYDARLDKWTRQRYGLRQRLGNSWYVEYG